MYNTEKVSAFDKQFLRKVKTVTLFAHPFWGTALSMIPVELTDKIPTAMTNGRKIYINPEFVEGLTVGEVQGVLLHELLHIIFEHCDKNRINGRNSQIWNMAGDFVINYILKSSGIDLPEGGLISREFTGKHTTEYVYDVLMQRVDKSDLLSVFVSGGFEDIKPSELTQSDIDRIKQVVAAAAQVGKAAGKIPAGMETFIDNLLNPKVPWYVVLRRYVQEIVGLRDDYTYVRPNKRYEDLVVPSAYSGERIAQIVIAIDSSASVQDEDLVQFASEVAKISEYVNDIVVLSCDTEVHEIAHKDNCEDKITSLKIKGRGGTDFSPVFDWVKSSGILPDVLVYLTDGYATFPSRPAYPVVWVIDSDATPPWGTTIRI